VRRGAFRAALYKTKQRLFAGTPEIKRIDATAFIVSGVLFNSSLLGICNV
jgi:hypothetical protein